MATTERLALARETVVDAQRIACLPAEELKAFCAEKRGSPDIPAKTNGSRRRIGLRERAAEVERRLSAIEDYARSAGLFRPEETLEFRLSQFLARWRLGEALAPMERSGGPGRGKKIPAPRILLWRCLKG